MAVLDNGVWHVNKEASELAVEDNFTAEIVSEKNKYHLYMSLACPFAHRPLLVIKYLGMLGGFLGYKLMHQYHSLPSHHAFADIFCL